jgi:hypothetical protein
MEVSAPPSPSTFSQWSASSMTPPDSFSDGGYHHPFYFRSHPIVIGRTPSPADGQLFDQNYIDNFPSGSHTLQPSEIIINETSSSEAERPAIPITGVYPVFSYGSPFSAEDPDYKKDPEAVRPWREDYKIFSKRAKGKVASFKALRTKGKISATGSGSKRIVPIDVSPMQNSPMGMTSTASQRYFSLYLLSKSNSQR